MPVTLEYLWVVSKKWKRDCKALLVLTNKATTSPVIKAYARVEHKGIWSILKSQVCTFISGTA